MIEVEIEDPAWPAALPETEALVVEAARIALASSCSPPRRGGTPLSEAKRPGGQAATTLAPPVASLRSRHPPRKPGGNENAGPVVILLTDDETVRGLNARFRGQDKPTNVLSFPAPEGPGAPLGDIALAFGVCAAEARNQGKPLADHLRHLVIHGVLHLMGWDHETDDEAEAMEALERGLLAALGVADPYRAEVGHD